MHLPSLWASEFSTHESGSCPGRTAPTTLRQPSVCAWQGSCSTEFAANCVKLSLVDLLLNRKLHCIAWWGVSKECPSAKSCKTLKNPEKHQIRCATAIQTLWASRPQAHRGFSSLVLKLSSAFLGSAWGWHFGDGTTGARPFPKGRFGQGGEGGWNDCGCVAWKRIELRSITPYPCFAIPGTPDYTICAIPTYISPIWCMSGERMQTRSKCSLGLLRWIWLNVPVVKLTDQLSRPWRDCRVDSEMQAKTGVWSRSNNTTTSFFSANGFVLVPCAVYSSSEANITAFLNRQECLIKGLQAHISFLQELLTGDGCQALTFAGVLGIDWYAHWHISRLRCWPKSARGVMNSCSFWRRSP